MSLKDNAKGLAKFAADTAKAAAKGDRVRSSPEEATRRFLICRACPLLLPSGRCDICKCDMGKKVTWEHAKCADKDDPKW